jgi:hypothetical protein
MGLTNKKTNGSDNKNQTQQPQQNSNLGNTTHDLVENAVDFIETNVKFEHGLPINENIVFHVLVRKKGRKINENLKALYGINSDVVAHAWQRVMEDAIALDKEIEADPENQIVRSDTLDENGETVMTKEFDGNGKTTSVTFYPQTHPELWERIQQLEKLCSEKKLDNGKQDELKKTESTPDNQVVRTDTFDDNGRKVLTVEISDPDSSPDVATSIGVQSSSSITVKSELPAGRIVCSTNGLKFTVEIPMAHLYLNKDYDPGEHYVSGSVPKLLGLLVKHSLLEVLQQICRIPNKLPITFTREKYGDYDSRMSYFTVVPGIEAVVDTETIKHNPYLAEVVAALVTILEKAQDYSASVVGDDCMNLLTSTTPYVVALGRYMYGDSYNYAASYQLGKFIADKMPYIDNHDLIIHNLYVVD